MTDITKSPKFDLRKFSEYELEEVYECWHGESLRRLREKDSADRTKKTVPAEQSEKTPDLADVRKLDTMYPWECVDFDKGQVRYEYLTQEQAFQLVAASKGSLRQRKMT